VAANPEDEGQSKTNTGGPDVFVHMSGLERAGLQQLNDDQKVSSYLRAWMDEYG
jgi:cold shock CspA family protein